MELKLLEGSHAGTYIKENFSFYTSNNNMM